MASFSLLSVLGNGSGRTASHHRFPLAAYQSGSVLVLWDYVRSGGETRKFVLLQPNQRCTSLFFSRDSQHVLGLWVSQSGQPTLTVWQVSDGARVAEQRLSDQSGGSEIWADFHSESSHVLLAHGDPVLSASVVSWSERASRLQPVAHGPLGGLGPLLGLRLLDEGRHFATCEAAAVVFWAFMERAPRQALRVDLNKPVRAFEVHAGLVYLLPERGRLQVMNFEGHREPQRALGPPAGLAFTAVAVRGPLVCLGLDDGALHLYSAAPAGELWRHVPFPTDSPGVPPQPVVSVTFGMNDDYVCVAFADATHGVVHLDSGRYVALRVGHSGAVRSFVMAPRLSVPPGLASSMPDSESFALARTLSFLTLAGDQTWVTWPRSGAPVRAALRTPPVPPPAVPPRESYAPRRAADQAGAPLVMSAAAFYPEARLGGDGGLAGAYLLLAGAADGSLHTLESEDGRGAAAGGPPRDVAWRTARVRPPPLELEPGGAGGGDERQLSACCHLAFSRCGQYAAASFRSGLAEMLHFPELTRALVLQGSSAPAGAQTQQQLPRRGAGPVVAGGQEVAHAKAFFVWRPGDPSRAYDRNIYIVSHAASVQELVLYEVYGLGDVWAKSSRGQFVLPAVCQAAGGEITDFSAHPSQLYLVVAAVLPAADTRSVALVFDMWTGQLLNSCALFGSLLTAPLLPLRPSLCIDPSGAFLFCASSPTAIGALGVSPGQAEQGPPGAADVVTDSLFARGPCPAGLQDAPRADQTASVVCIIDFRTGQQTYQSTVEVSCLAIGSLAHDPAQLLLGAHDGSVSVWHPPEAVSSRIRGLLDDSRELALAEKRRLGEVPGPPAPPELEEAVAAHWSAQAGRLDWPSWGEGGQRQPAARRAPLRPPSPPVQLLPRADARGAAGQGEEADDDVVVQARRRWPPPAAAAAGRRPAGAAEGEGWCPRPAAAEASRSWPPPESPPRGRAPLDRSAGWPPREAPSPAPAAPGASGPAPRVGPGALAPPKRTLALDGPRPEKDEVSGLEVGEVPGGAEEPGWARPPRGGFSGGPRSGAPAAHRPPEPAELLVAAPEFHEEFGTSHEHFGDPAPTPTGGAWEAALRLKSGPGACRQPSAFGGGLRAARHLGVLRAVLSEIDRFELENPESRALESPRSARSGDRELARAALGGAEPCTA